jgi:AraC-like DNA-binding protein
MQDQRARPLDRFPLITTSDPAELERVMVSEYRVKRFELFGDKRDFHARFNQLQLGSVGFVYSIISTNALIAFPADDTVRLHLGIRGSGDAVVGTTRLALVPGGACITPAYTGLEVRFDGFFERVVLRFSETALRRKLETILGVDINAPLQFDIVARAQHPNIRLLREIALDIVSNLHTFIPEASPAVQTEIGQAALLALLYGAPHNYSHLLATDAKAVAPWQVRQAVDYIESHWNKPLQVDDIAAAINASSRSLFKTFKASMGVSPMEYVRTIRIKKARKMLVLATHDASVTGVALACGFHNMGHFAKDYREAFGELPSLTLARARTLVHSRTRQSA